MEQTLRNVDVSFTMVQYICEHYKPLSYSTCQIVCEIPTNCKPENCPIFNVEKEEEWD